jgi:hypothetical protein
MICIQEQESFMHYIHDVIHIGLSVSNLSHAIESLKTNHGKDKISDILNSKMKDEKYSSEMIYPLVKIIYTMPSHISYDKLEFYNKKLEALKLFEENGANMKIICGKIPTLLESITRYAPLFLEKKPSNSDRLIDLYYENELIDYKIRDYLYQFELSVIEI